MTIAKALRAATETLSGSSDTARLDAELLMAHALGVTRSDLLLHHMDRDAPAEFVGLIERRAHHEPTAHITGVQEFYGRPFRVTRDTLIPRGDSETLVGAALELAPAAKRIIDLGTGSGALLITVLLELEGASGIGIDASRAALRVAQENAQALGLIGAAARFLERDWTRDRWTADLGTFDLVLCNPPYVEERAVLDRDVREFEPASALFAGPEGLDDHCVLLPQLRKLMNRGAIAIFEIGAEQAEQVTKIAQDHGFSVEIRKDLANRPRCAILR